ncbi:hypothetical protein [Solibacillus sp. NPDC093137]|uniref:hypothetical protein n=1 Tax=Solibacillus sp. NPDC093137 TaxID=3390678 RepID=UPI003D04F36E
MNVSQTQFLKELQSQLKVDEKKHKTSLWTVMDYKYELCVPASKDCFAIYSPFTYELLQPDKETFNNLIELFSLEGEATNILDNLDSLGEDEILAWVHEHVDTEAISVPQQQVSFIVNNQVFLTKKEVEQYLENDGANNHSQDAHPYEMSLYKSGAMEKLLDIVTNAVFE